MHLHNASDWQTWLRGLGLVSMQPCYVELLTALQVKVLVKVKAVVLMWSLLAVLVSDFR